MAMLLVFCIFVFSGIACHLIAKTRGLKPMFWGIMGLLFGPLAIPFIFLKGQTDKDR